MYGTPRVSFCKGTYEGHLESSKCGCIVSANPVEPSAFPWNSIRCVKIATSLARLQCHYQLQNFSGLETCIFFQYLYHLCTMKIFNVIIIFSIRGDYFLDITIINVVLIYITIILSCAGLVVDRIRMAAYFAQAAGGAEGKFAGRLGGSAGPPLRQRNRAPPGRCQGPALLCESHIPIGNTRIRGREPSM